MSNDTRLKEVYTPASTKFEDDKTLRDTFTHEVENDRVAWYVDYYTEDPERHRVRYLAKSSDFIVMMTNENKEERDPADLDSSQWGGDDVAEWFSKDGEKVYHRWIYLFTHEATGEEFGIHCEAYRVFAFGPNSLSLPTSNLWDEYVEHGIHGPMKACVNGVKLKGIIVDPDVGGEITSQGFLTQYVSGLASVLDSK